MTDLTAEGREKLRNIVVESICRHGDVCYDDLCGCGLDAIREAVPDLLNALEAAEAERDALRAALQSAVAACPRRCNEGTFRYPTWQGWETRPCKVCGPWRKLLEGKP